MACLVQLQFAIIILDFLKFVISERDFPYVLQRDGHFIKQYKVLVLCCVTGSRISMSRMSQHPQCEDGAGISLFYHKANNKQTYLKFEQKVSLRNLRIESQKINTYLLLGVRQTVLDDFHVELKGSTCAYPGRGLEPL